MGHDIMDESGTPIGCSLDGAGSHTPSSAPPRSLTTAREMDALRESMASGETDGATASRIAADRAIDAAMKRSDRIREHGAVPAFPCDSREARIFAGMSLRDYFAAQAMQGLCASNFYDRMYARLRKPDDAPFTGNDPAVFLGDLPIVRIAAHIAYEYADAMLAARKAVS